MSNYLVTGGEGFIGSHIAKLVDAETYDLKSHKDILDETLLTQAVQGKQGIFHCAARIIVPESFEMVDEYYRTNVEGTQAVISAAESVGARIVFSSSAAVYGDSDSLVSESVSLFPKSPYAQNKRDGEVLLATSSVPHVALRYFNIYGPRQSTAYAAVIMTFIRKALAGEDIVIDGDGTQVRDFVFVDDVAAANVAAMNATIDAFQVCNIGSGVPVTINQLAQKIIELTNSSSRIRYGEPRTGDISYSLADISKARTILGWEPKVSLDEGLRRTIEYYKSNKESF
jgi:UDP-glucose 4-epimerase